MFYPNSTTRPPFFFFFQIQSLKTVQIYLWITTCLKILDKTTNLPRLLNVWFIHVVKGSFYVSFSKKEVGLGALHQSTILPLPSCAQTLSPSPREDAAKWAYSLFLSQNELFSSFCRELTFLQFLPQDCLFSSFCCRRNFSLVSAAGLTFLQFLLRNELFFSFCRKRDFSLISAVGLTFLLCNKTFLLCNKASCCVVKLSVVYWSCLLCIKTVCYVLKLSAVL